jgi:hypothetical protein
MIGIDTIIEVGAKILDRVIPDTNARESAKAELIKAAQSNDFQLAMGQLEINKVEASNPSLFVSGWRPFVGWTCSASFALHFVIFPILNFIIVGLGYKEIVISFDMTTLMTTLGGLLGIGGLRTYEKIKGVTK